jgi:hypothetical protein
MEDYQNGYDKEYFATLPLVDKYKYIKGMVDTLTFQKHNKSETDFRIRYHLHSDGSIQRYDYVTNESSMIAHECILPNTFFKFPCKGIKKGDTFAILTDKECLDMRDLMNELFLKC